MDKKKPINSTADVVAKASDFVIEYKDVQMFSQNYKLDSHVLGEGTVFLQLCYSFASILSS